MNKKNNTEENGKYGETFNAKKGFTAEAICAIGKKSRSLIRKTEARASLQRKQKNSQEQQDGTTLCVQEVSVLLKFLLLRIQRRKFRLKT